MPYTPQSGIHGVRIDRKLSRYVVLLVQDGERYFGGYFPLSEQGWHAARSAALALAHQHPRKPRPRSKSGYPKNAAVTLRHLPKPSTPIRSATGVRNVYEDIVHNRYHVQIRRNNVRYSGGYFPRTPDGLTLAAARAARLREELQKGNTK